MSQITESPQKTQKSQPTQKQLKQAKRKKKIALQSFLQKNESSSLDLVTKQSIQSQQEQKTEEMESHVCNVCQVEIGDRKKVCGFCNLGACPDHLRKKRKSKHTHKFVKICDGCEDKYLFNKYMKLQLKNQESIQAQQTIVGTKKAQVQMQQKGRKTKLKMLYHKQNQVLSLKRDHQTRYSTQMNQLSQKFQKLFKKQKQLDQLNNHILLLQSTLPPSYEDDFRALEIENDKVNRQLLKYQRDCNEALKAKSKREKEIYDQYHRWEQKQRDKIAKKQDQCCLF